MTHWTVVDVDKFHKLPLRVRARKLLRWIEDMDEARRDEAIPPGHEGAVLELEGMLWSALKNLVLIQIDLTDKPDPDDIPF